MQYVAIYLAIALPLTLLVGKMIAFGQGPDYDQRRNEEELEALREMANEKAARKLKVAHA